LSYFTAVRIYSIFELCLFATLLVFAIGGWSDDAETVLGWSHGIGWLILCALVLYGATRGIFTWVVLALTVSPAGPLGSTIGIEYQARHSRTSSPIKAEGHLPSTAADSQPLSSRGGSSPGSDSQADGG